MVYFSSHLARVLSLVNVSRVVEPSPHRISIVIFSPSVWIFVSFIFFQLSQVSPVAVSMASATCPHSAAPSSPAVSVAS